MADVFAFPAKDAVWPGDGETLQGTEQEDLRVGELLAAKKEMEQRNRLCTCCSIICAATGVTGVSGLVLQVGDKLGFLHFSAFTALTLVLLASTAFVVCGAVLAQWTPTARLGKKLIHRVMYTRSNWETDTLRSFCEVGIWLSVIWATFQKSGGGAGGLVMALVCSTIAGCLLAIMGDALTEPLRALESYHRDANSARSCNQTDLKANQMCITSGSLMMIILYGHGAIQLIYEYCQYISIACMLASLAGLCLLLMSRLIQFWTPMRHAGITLSARITDTANNWRKYPVRSAIESTFWLGIVIGTYELKGNVLSALQVGTVSGIVICLSSELFWHRESAEDKDSDGQPILAPLCIFVYGVFGVLVTIFAQAEDWCTAGVLSTIAGVAFTGAGQLCLKWHPTHRAGMVINGRVLNSAKNWNEYPVRSFLEVSLWLVGTWGSYANTGSVIFSTGAGCVTGIAAVLANHHLGWGVSSQSTDASDGQALQSPEGDVSANIAQSKICSKGGEQGADVSSGVKAGSAAGQGEVTPAAFARGSAAARQQTFTWGEVATHSTQGDTWVVIDRRVYDVSDWAPSHPGGSIIYKFAGVDATDQFAAFHMPRVAKRLPKFLIGKIEDSTPCCDSNDSAEQLARVVPSPATLDYRALREKLWNEGYFEAEDSYYYGRAGVCAGLLMTSIMGVLVLPSTCFWLQCVGAGALMGLGWQQIAFLAHDAAHYGIHKPVSGGGMNYLAWVLASVSFGISVSMWNEEHAVHHAITLRPREDPQFNYLPLWLISMKELDVPGTSLDRVTQLLISIQHFTFLPLVVLIGRFNFYLISIAFAVKRVVMGPTNFARFCGVMDLIGMAIFWTWYVALVTQLDGTWSRCVFVLVSHWVCGVLHIQLLLSHLFTETFTADEERKEQFFAFQMKTTRNIDAASWYENLFHGGLEFQIEHHLFPQLPRHNLHRVKPFVQDICKRHGIAYQSASGSEVFIEVMRNFRHLAKAILECEII